MGKYDVPHDVPSEDSLEIRKDQEKSELPRAERATEHVEGQDVRHGAEVNREVDAARAEHLKEQLIEKQRKPDNGRYGDFSPDEVGDDGYLHLPEEEMKNVTEQLRKLKRRATVATLATGTRIAAEYDIK